MSVSWDKIHRENALGKILPPFLPPTYLRCQQSLCKAVQVQKQKDKPHKAVEALWGLVKVWIGGEGGIRTHVQAINPQPDFESGPLRPLRYLSARKEPEGIWNSIRRLRGWQVFYVPASGRRPRRSRKKSRNSPPQAASSTPDTTSKR